MCSSDHFLNLDHCRASKAKLRTLKIKNRLPYWSNREMVMTEEKNVNVESPPLQNNIHSHLQKHWKLYAREGILFIILGIVANVIPHVVFKKVAIVFSGLMLVGGFVQFVRSVRFIWISGLNLFLITGLLQLAIGFYFLVEEPTKGKITLALLLIIYLSIESAIKLLLAFMMRPLVQWDGMFFGGIVSFLMVGIILTNWPDISAWLLGLLVGMNMIFYGLSLLHISLSHKADD